MHERLYVVPLDEGSRKHGDWLLGELCRKFTLKPQTGIVARLPEEAYNVQNNQYYATAILSKLELLKGSDYEMIMAITEEDLFIPSQNFVWGQANSASRTAIISINRIRPEFYGLPEDEELVNARILNIASHELGHMMGLKNCRQPECQMNVAENISQLDSRSDTFCTDCILNLTLPTKVRI